jgi:hypothetical protein
LKNVASGFSNWLAGRLCHRHVDDDREFERAQGLPHALAVRE